MIIPPRVVRLGNGETILTQNARTIPLDRDRKDHRREPGGMLVLMLDHRKRDMIAHRCSPFPHAEPRQAPKQYWMIVWMQYFLVAGFTLFPSLAFILPRSAFFATNVCTTAPKGKMCPFVTIDLKKLSLRNFKTPTFSPLYHHPSTIVSHN